MAMPMDAGITRDDVMIAGVPPDAGFVNSCPRWYNDVMRQGIHGLLNLIKGTRSMKKTLPPKVKVFAAAKQRQLDELLEKNSEGTIAPAEKVCLERLVAEAETLMVQNAQLLARFSQIESAAQPTAAVPVTVWVTPQPTGR
jgi:hypothetical protein